MVGRYVGAWFGMMALAIVNGGLRDLTYRSTVGDLAAHQISTAGLIILCGVYFRVITRMWRIQSARQAWIIGGLWAAMTLGFEFGMGLLVNGSSISQVLHAYNLLDGQVWVLVPLWVLIGPYLFSRYAPPRPAA